MRIPLSYNLRNLAVRRTTTLLTAGGIGLTVAVLMAVLALGEGLRTSLEASGHPLNVLVTRKGATGELTSILNREAFQIVKTHAGIARSSSGEPLASLELMTGISLDTGDSVHLVNVTLRGLLPSGFELRPQVKLVEGRMFDAGKREVVVGKSIAANYAPARLGGRIAFARGEWTVVGIVDAGRSTGNNEVFADLNQVASAYNRDQALSSVLVRALDDAAVEPLRAALDQDRRVTVQAQRERDYYRAQMSSAAPVRFMGGLVALMLAIGSSVAAMNTMYAAVARRSAEIGTLRVLGFSRRSVLTSFLVESVMLSLAGGLAGCAMSFPLNNVSTRMSSLTTFTEFAFEFRITPEIMAAGIVFALVMGVIGGILPAWNASRKQVLAALRG